MPFFTITHIMISIYAIGLIISAVSFLLVGTLQPSNYQKELSHTIVFATIMQLGYWFYSTGNTFEEMLQAQKLIYLGGCMVPYYLTLLFATFCRVEIHKGSRLTMYFGSLLMAIISMTCDLHPLMHKAVEMVDVNGIQRLNITAGPLMYWYNFRCLVYFVTMLWLAIRNYRKSSRRRNLHTVILMQTATLPYTLFLIEAIFKGLRPAVVALIAGPCVKLGRTAKITWSSLWLPVLVAGLIALLGLSPVYIILIVGLGAFAYGYFFKKED